MAEKWNVPLEFVSTIHIIYEQTRYSDVQMLKALTFEEYGHTDC